MGRWEHGTTVAGGRGRENHGEQCSLFSSIHIFFLFLKSSLHLFMGGFFFFFFSSLILAFSNLAFSSS